MVDPVKSILNRIAPSTRPDAEPVKPLRSRDGTKAIITMHAPAVRNQLKALALETDKTQQELVAEALNMIFLKYGKDPIA